jgi:Zn-finger nucleic acid-binding protein
LIRCPVCESATVTIVLNSTPHASCGRCGATWIQEGSWQRSIQSPRPRSLPLDVIRLPRPDEREVETVTEPDDPAERAVGT